MRRALFRRSKHAIFSATPYFYELCVFGEERTRNFSDLFDGTIFVDHGFLSMRSTTF